jgi:uncharacterized membrane protein YfcA
MIVLFVIAALSVVQSLFGVGLLVFGTPTFLLLGYSFGETLVILLPASLTISVLQVAASHRQDPVFVRSFMLWCMLPLGLSLAALLLSGLTANLSPVVAVLLFVFVCLRSFPALQSTASRLVAAHQKPWLVAMGVVHGLSNLGGGMLVIFAGSKFRRKEDVRALVAFCYSCFAAVQLLVLAVLTPGAFGWMQVGYAAIAGIVFLLVGQRVFRWVSNPAFDWLLTGFAAAYACVLALRSAGIL